MKRLIVTFLTPIIFSCGAGLTEQADSGNVLKSFTFAVDTLVVNSGESFFNLKNLSKFVAANYFSISSEADTLYFFDRHRLLLQEVDLNSLRLIATYPFESEGPDGVGNFVFTFKRLPTGDFFVKDLFGACSIYTKAGKKIKTLKLNGEAILIETGLEPTLIGSDLLIDQDAQQLYSVPRNLLTKKMVFVVMDSTGSNGKVYDILEFDRAFNFNVKLEMAGGGGLRAENTCLQKPNNLVILSSSFSSNIYVYSPEGDNLSYKKYSHELTPAEKDVEVKSTVFSEKEYEAELDKLYAQIEYLDFYWDAEGGRYYRFAKKGLEVVDPALPRKFDFFLFCL